MFSEMNLRDPEPEMEPVYDSSMHTRELQNPAKENTLAKSPIQPRSPDAIVAKTMSLNIPTSALNPEGIQ